MSFQQQLTQQKQAIYNTTASNWAPDTQSLSQILECFRLTIHPQTTNVQHRQVYDMLAQAKKHPEFSNYLAFIMVNPNEHPNVRSQAGFKLKACIESGFDSMNPSVQEYIKLQAFQATFDALPVIRNCASSVVTGIAMKQALRGWRPILLDLCDFLNKEAKMEVKLQGAIGVLAKICEDGASYGYLSEGEMEPVVRAALIPKLLEVLRWQNMPPTVTSKALKALLHVFESGGWLENDDTLKSYLEALFLLIQTNTNSGVRIQLCHALNDLVVAKWHKITNHMRYIVQFMLKMSNDNDDQLATVAVEFWHSFLSMVEENDVLMPLLKNHLQFLIPILLYRMAYSHTEVLILNAENPEEDAHLADRTEDQRPIFASQTVFNSKEEKEEADSYEADISALENWSLRKSSASNLDKLSYFLPREVLHVIMPLFQQNLVHQDWKIREASILALGAIAQGCYTHIQPFLPKFIAFLLQNVNDDRYLVRRISCWTLSRYSKWVLTEKDEKYFSPCMAALLNRTQDKNKKVQEAACSAFAALEETAGSRLLPYTGLIIKALMNAFHKYQRNNMVILFDAIATLADSLGSDLNSPEYVNLLMPPLLQRWNATPDNNTQLIPLLECMTSIAGALKLGFAPYAKIVYNRCIQLIGKNLVLEQQARMQIQQGFLDAEMPNKDFVVCSLDLLAGVIEAMGSASEELLGKGNLLNNLWFDCVTSNEADVRQSAFALLGDLAKACIGHLRPHMSKYVQLCMKHMDVWFPKVCSNCSWALGEIITKLSQNEIKSFVDPLLERSRVVLNNGECPRGTAENIAIMLGRLCGRVPLVVGANTTFQGLCMQWLQILPFISFQKDKQFSYLGLCILCESLPQMMINIYPQILTVMCEYRMGPEQQHLPPLSEDKVFMRLLQLCVTWKANMQQPMWEGFFAKLDVKHRQKVLSLMQGYLQMAQQQQQQQQQMYMTMQQQQQQQQQQ